MFRALNKHLEVVKRATREAEWQIETLVSLARGRAQALLHHTGGTGFGGVGSLAGSSILSPAQVEVYASLAQQNPLGTPEPLNMDGLGSRSSSESADVERATPEMDTGSATLAALDGIVQDDWVLEPRKETQVDNMNHVNLSDGQVDAHEAYPEQRSDQATVGADDGILVVSQRTSQLSPTPSTVGDGHGGASSARSTKRRKRADRGDRSDAVENGMYLWGWKMGVVD